MCRITFHACDFERCPEAPWLGICGVQPFLSFRSFLVLLQTVILHRSLWFNFLDQSWKIVPSKLSVITLFKAHFESHILSLTLWLHDDPLLNFHFLPSFIQEIFAECLPWDRLCSQPWGYTTEKNKSLFSGRLHLSMGVQIVNKQLNTTIKYNLSGCYVGQWGKIKHRNGDQSWHHSGERELFLHWGSEKTFLQGVIRALLMECRSFEVKYSGESMSRLVLVIYSYKTSYPKM